MPSRLKSLLVFIAVFSLFNTLRAQAQNLQQLQQYQQLQQQERDRRQANPEATPGFEPSGQTICAGNIPPEGTIITATGNSIDCGGSCRARRIEPLHGHIMVICSQQPIPDNYEIQSVTTTPSCNCIGEEDNAYVIRAITGTLTNPDAAHGGSQGGPGSSGAPGGSFGGN
jgi:type II secretory pathway pseudopilin PulG